MSVENSNTTHAVEIRVYIDWAAIKEADRLTRSRLYWVRDIGELGYYVVYLFGPSVVLGWFGVRGVIGYSFGPDRSAVRALISGVVALIPVVLGALVVKGFRQVKRKRREMCGWLQLKFTEDGISRTDLRGSTFSDPWSSYSGFYEGQRVIVCPVKGTNVYLRIPVATLFDAERREVRDVLSRHLPLLSRDRFREYMREGRG